VGGSHPKKNKKPPGLPTLFSLTRIFARGIQKG